MFCVLFATNHHHTQFPVIDLATSRTRYSDDMMDQELVRGEIDVHGISSSLSDQSQALDYVASLVGGNLQLERPTTAQSCIASDGSDSDRGSVYSDSCSVVAVTEHNHLAASCSSERDQSTEESKLLAGLRTSNVENKFTRATAVVPNTFTAPVAPPENNRKASMAPSTQRSVWQTVPEKIIQLKRGLSVFNVRHLTHGKPPLPPAANSQLSNISLSYPYAIDPSRPPHYKVAADLAPADRPAATLSRLTQPRRQDSSDAEDEIGFIDAMGGRSHTITPCLHHNSPKACDVSRAEDIHKPSHTVLSTLSLSVFSLVCFLMFLNLLSSVLEQSLLSLYALNHSVCIFSWVYRRII